MNNIYGIVELPGVTVTAINPNRGNKALHDYIMGVNSMRNDIMKERGISDSRWADLSKQAVNITGVESKNGTSVRYKVKNALPDWMLHATQYIVRGKTMPISRGLSQIKVIPSQKQLNARYSKYGINDQTLKNSNFKQGQATVIKMDENRKSMKNNYTWKDGTPMTTEEANNIYWNRGRLTSGLNDKNDNSNSGVVYNNKFNDRKIIF